MDPTLIGLAVLVVLNIFVWVFASGRMTGKVNTRLNNIEKRLDDPPMLPECRELFTEIKEGLSQLNGEIKGMLTTMKGYQKDNERRHTRSKK